MQGSLLNGVRRRIECGNANQKNNRRDSDVMMRSGEKENSSEDKKNTDHLGERPGFSEDHKADDAEEYRKKRPGNVHNRCIDMIECKEEHEVTRVGKHGAADNPRY